MWSKYCLPDNMLHVLYTLLKRTVKTYIMKPKISRKDQQEQVKNKKYIYNENL